MDCSRARSAPNWFDTDGNRPVAYYWAAFWNQADRRLVGLRRWQIRDNGRIEGVDWCYGWSGPAVDALIAAEALR